MPNLSIRSMLCTAAGVALFAAPVMAQDTMSNQPTTTTTTTTGAPTTTTGTATSTTGAATTTTTPSGQTVTTYPGNMGPPPADAMNKTYPVCRRGMTDECQNPGEGGAPGRDRASDYKGGPAAHGGMSAGRGHHHRMHHRRH